MQQLVKQLSETMAGLMKFSSDIDFDSASENTNNYTKLMKLSEGVLSSGAKVALSVLMLESLLGDKQNQYSPASYHSIFRVLFPFMDALKDRQYELLHKLLTQGQAKSDSLLDKMDKMNDPTSNSMWHDPVDPPFYPSTHKGKIYSSSSFGKIKPVAGDDDKAVQDLAGFTHMVHSTHITDNFAEFFSCSSDGKDYLVLKGHENKDYVGPKLVWMSPDIKATQDALESRYGPVSFVISKGAVQRAFAAGDAKERKVQCRVLGTREYKKESCHTYLISKRKHDYLNIVKADNWTDARVHAGSVGEKYDHSTFAFETDELRIPLSEVRVVFHNHNDGTGRFCLRGRLGHVCPNTAFSAAFAKELASKRVPERAWQQLVLHDRITLKKEVLEDKEHSESELPRGTKRHRGVDNVDGEQ